MANGLDEARALAHAARIRALDGHARRAAAGRHRVRHPRRRHARSGRRLPGRARHRRRLGPLGVHQDRAQMTDRLLRAIENPHVDILGHPTGRRILDARAVSIRHRGGGRRRGAARRGARDQFAGRPARPERRARPARPRSRRDARHLERRALAHGLRRLRWGTTVARRAWLEPSQILNAQPFDRLVAGLRRHRQS